jgi:hypothetical protein
VTPSPLAEVAQLRHHLGVALNNNEILTGELMDRAGSDVALMESVADLTSALYEPGWVRFAAITEQEFDAGALTQMRAICRLMSLKNPLIRRGLGLRSAYVWGQGVEITARANGSEPGEQDVQAVVEAFLTDEGNARAVTGPAAQNRLEHALGTDGEIFLALFTRPTTGEVQVRTILADEIVEAIPNPEDRSEPQFYRRRWTQAAIDPATGATEVTSMERLYPAVGYRPKTRPARFGQIDVAWDSPILHVDVNRPEGWTRGVPDAYAAVDWARAYKVFLEDWATLVKALSRFAYRLTAKGSQRAQARTRLAQAPGRDPATGHAQDVGATAIIPPDAMLEAVPKTGATIDSESGRPIAAMVAAALGVPVTMLLGDPGTTGARATAETLDRPTELEMGQRQKLWTSVYQRILRYVITESVRAPQGELRGVITQDKWGRETVALAGDTPTTVDVVWPDLDETDPAILVKAVVEANSTGTMPPEMVLRLLLTALGVRNVDELVEKMLDDETGEFVWPDVAPMGGSPPGDAARAGGDPAATGDGLMAPDVLDDPAAARQADADFGLFGGQSNAPGSGLGPGSGEQDDDEDEDDVDLARFRL